MKPENFVDDLFTNFLAGDSRSFTLLFDHVYNRLFRYGLAIAHRKDLVRDAIQDLFVYVWEKRDKIENVASAEVYLLGALRLRIFDALRRDTRRRSRSFKFLREQSPANLEGEYWLGKEEESDPRREMLRLELLALPPRQREAVHLRFYEGLSYPQIGEVLGVSHQVARNYGHRGLDKLRKTLANWGERKKIK